MAQFRREVGFLKKISDKVEIEYWLNKGKIREQFDTKDLVFYLHKYEKGEYLTTPNNSTSHLLFVVEGTVQVYNIYDDGGIAPVNQIDSPTLIGDIEFYKHENSLYFVEAKTDVICIALSMKKYQKVLNCDLKFLHTIIQSYVDKLKVFSSMDIKASTIEERVIFYMKTISPSNEINGIESVIHKIRCSRRQIQRVLNKLCIEGKVERIGKGKYRLVQEKR